MIFINICLHYSFIYLIYLLKFTSGKETSITEQYNSIIELIQTDRTASHNPQVTKQRKLRISRKVFKVFMVLIFKDECGRVTPCMCQLHLYAQVSYVHVPHLECETDFYFLKGMHNDSTLYAVRIIVTVKYLFKIMHNI